MAKRRGPGLTAVHFSDSEYYRGVIRMMQVSGEFDRIQVAVFGKYKFGSVSRVFSELENEGYIRATGAKGRYSTMELKRNPDLRGFRINYASGRSGFRTSVTYKKTARWSELMTRWHAFLKGIERRAERPVAAAPVPQAIAVCA